MKRALLVLLVLCLGALMLTYFYFETIMRRGIEIAGSNALGTAVTVTGVSLSPLSGRGNIRGLSIANPEGFDAPYAIELEALEIELNLRSLFTDVIEINTIVVHAAQVTYETRIVTDNIRTLLAGLPAEGAAPVVETAPDAAPTKQLIIRDLHIIAPQINLHTRAAIAPILLPDIRMSNIGQQNDAASVPEAARDILLALNRALLSAGIPNMDILLDSAREQLQDGASRLGDAVENLGDGVRRLFNR
jgi:hypothetical protein